MWDLPPPVSDGPLVPHVAEWILNHWATRPGAFYYYSLMEVQLIYSVVLASAIQHLHYIYIRFFSLIGYYKILTIVPCAIQ